jgi:hypothetical protein
MSRLFIGTTSATILLFNATGPLFNFSASTSTSVNQALNVVLALDDTDLFEHISETGFVTDNLGLPGAKVETDGLACASRGATPVVPACSR